MADEGWLPVADAQRIFKHVVVTILLGAGFGLVSAVFVYVVPDWKEPAELVDGFVLLGALIILGVKLLWGFARGNGTNAFAIA
jgi:hypothetical protein